MPRILVEVLASTRPRATGSPRVRPRKHIQIGSNLAQPPTPGAQRRTRLEIQRLAEDPESDPRMVGEAEDTPTEIAVRCIRSAQWPVSPDG
jgi:hypothetical protein